MTRGLNRSLARWLVVVAVSAVLVVGAARSMQALRPDSFWSSFSIEYSEVERFDSLEEMTGSADAVVIATIDHIVSGRRFGDPEQPAVYATVTMSIEEVLVDRTGLLTQTPVSLEFLMPTGATAADFESLNATLPLPRGLLFLRHKQDEARRLGLSAREQAENRGFFRLVNSRALIHDVEGAASPVVTSQDEFLSALAGDGFSDVVTTVRKAVELAP